MGRGLVYRCPNCGKEYHVLVGSGFVFPEVYRETLLRVLNGEYGVRLQNEIKTSPFAAIDAEYHLYFNRKIPKKYSILITEKELFVNWDMFRMLQVVILKKCIG